MPPKKNVFYPCPNCKSSIRQDVFVAHFQMCTFGDTHDAGDCKSNLDSLHSLFPPDDIICKPTNNTATQSFTIANDNVVRPTKSKKRKKLKLTVETSLRDPGTLPPKPSYTYAIMGATSQTEKFSNRKFKKRTQTVAHSMPSFLNQGSKTLQSDGLQQHNFKNVVDRHALMNFYGPRGSDVEKPDSSHSPNNMRHNASSSPMFENGVFDAHFYDDGSDVDNEQHDHEFIQTQDTPSSPNNNLNRNEVDSSEDEHGNNTTPAVLPNDALLQMRDKAPANVDIVYSPREMFWLELAGILQDTNAPKYLYKSIQQWAMKLVNDEHCIGMSTLGYKELIQRMAVRHGLANSRPYVQQLSLPSEHILSVVRFNFMAQVHSLLSDDTLMRPENLVFGDDPHKKFKKEKFLGDIETSNFYILSQEMKCTKDGDVLVVIIFFIDKTHDKGNCFEPVSFTLGIFKRHVRQSPEAWRHVGFIPGLIDKLIPLFNHRRKDVANHKSIDYHYVLREILGDIINVTSLKDGLKWNIGGKDCNLKFVVFNILGDIEGFDKLCIRKKSHQGRRMTHSCDLKREHCMDPTATCTFHNFDTINRMMEKTYDTTNRFTDEERTEAEKFLEDMYFYPGVRNAFLGADFGANKNGLNSACGVCLMHTFKEKFPDIVVDLFLGLLGKSEDTVGKLQLEISMPRLISKITKQSSRNYPKISKFAFRLQKGKIKYDANQKYARVFALYLYSLTSSCHGLFVTVHKKPLADLNLCSSLLHDSLTIYEFLYQDKFPRKFLEASAQDEMPMACQPVQRYLQKFQEVDNLIFPGEDKSIFPKFHYLIHVPIHILDLGSSKNFDGGSSEGNFVKIAKKPARKTQGRSELIDIQLCNNYADDNILRRALDHSSLKPYGSSAVHRASNTENVGEGVMDSDGSDLDSDDDSEDGCFDDIPLMSEGTGINSQSSKFTICLEEDTIRVKPKKSNVGYVRQFPLASVQVIYNVLINQEPREILDNTIHGFTCLSREGSIYRAHPSYRSGQEWYDFAVIKWEEGRIQNAIAATTPGERRRNVTLPQSSYNAVAKICMFIDLRKANLRENSSFKKELYVLIHSVEMNNENTGPVVKAVEEWQRRGSPKLAKFWTKEKGYHIIPVTQIHSPAFVLQDYSDPEMITETEYLIEVEPFEDWKFVINRELGCRDKY